MAVDSQGRPSLPSPEVVAFTTADAGNYLAAPDNVKVTPGLNNAYVVVSWDAVAGATLYRVLGKDSGKFDPKIIQNFVTTGEPLPIAGVSTPYWRYSTYGMYPVYAGYTAFRHYYGDVTTTSYVVYSYYGAYLGYPLYAAYVPYGVFKVIAMKNSGDVMSPSSAESRVVPPGATDIAASTGVTSTFGGSLSVQNTSTAADGAACAIPAASLNQNTAVTISVQSSGTAFNTALPLGLVKQTAPIDFDIGNAAILGGQTITVTLPVPTGKTPSAMKFYHWLNNAWVEETAGRVNGVGIVSVTVSSLSPFVLGDVTGGGGSAGGGGGGGGGCFLGTARNR